MARIDQQGLGPSVAINKQTHNEWHLAIDEVEKQARRLYNVEQNVDTIQAAMEQVEAMMMHMV